MNIENNGISYSDDYDLPALHFKDWRLISEYWNSLFLIAVSIGMSFLVLTILHSWILATLLFMLLQWLLLPIYFPVSYSVNKQGIEVKTFFSATFICWENINHCRQLSRGFLLFPQKDSYPLEIMRSQYIAVPKDELEFVLKWLDVNEIEKRD
ncbi:MAG: hypothetical protein Q4C95_05095 [Planctomycetia bacterium]|nr:hypothetical protein [Planctomycetia bacterium]